MKRYINPYIPVLCAILALLSPACASLELPADIPTARDPALVRKIFEDIDERNNTIKKSDAWIRNAYASIGIRKLNDIPPAEYASYRRFVDNGEMYIIVHPGYFPFFDKWDIPRPEADYSAGLPSQNAFDRLLASIPPDGNVFRTAGEQERIIRDFLEYVSYDKKLVVLILPGKYQKHITYGKHPDYDEYARYINEITNRAGNILYVESFDHDKGTITAEDVGMLLQFLKGTGSGTVLLGGGFMGRCLDNFYGQLKSVMFAKNINHVLELVTFSPTDMKRDKVDLLDSKGQVSQKKSLDYFSSYAYNSATEEWLAWRPFNLYKIYEIR